MAGVEEQAGGRGGGGGGGVMLGEEEGMGVFPGSGANLVGS